MPDLLPGQDKDVEEALDILRKAPQKPAVIEAIEKGEYILDKYPVALHGNLGEALERMFTNFVEEDDPTIIKFLMSFPPDTTTTEDGTQETE